MIIRIKGNEVTSRAASFITALGLDCGAHCKTTFIHLWIEMVPLKFSVLTLFKLPLLTPLTLLQNSFLFDILIILTWDILYQNAHFVPRGGFAGFDFSTFL